VRRLIRFEAPAAPASIRLARLLATGVASALDFTVDDLEDVVEGTLRLSFEVEAGELWVEGTAPDFGQPGTLSPFSTQIVLATARSSEVWRDDGHLRFRLRCGPRPSGGLRPV